MSYSTPWFPGSKAGWTLEWRWSESFHSYFLSMWGNEMQNFLPFFSFSSIYLPCWQSNLFSGKKLEAGVSVGTGKWVCSDQGQVEGMPSEEHKAQGCLVSRPGLGIYGHWSFLGAQEMLFSLTIFSIENAPAHHICMVGTDFLGHFARNLHLDRIFYQVKTLTFSVTLFSPLLDG